MFGPRTSNRRTGGRRLRRVASAGVVATAAVLIASVPPALADGGGDPFPPPGGDPGVTALTLNPSTVTGGGSATGTAKLEFAVNRDTIQVVVFSSNPDLVTVPAVVGLHTGQSSVSFPVTTGQVSATTTVQVTALANNKSASATLTIVPN